jgi:iron complex transport system ATP-binding protein
MVMHDLNLTVSVAQHIAFVMNGRIISAGTADEVISADLLGQAFDCTVRMKTQPQSGPWFLPQSCTVNDDAFLQRHP